MKFKKKAVIVDAVLLDGTFDCLKKLEGLGTDTRRVRAS